jgi:hypothetical protein
MKSSLSQPNSPLAILQLPTQYKSSVPELISRQVGVSYSTQLLLTWTLLYNRAARITQKTQPPFVVKASLQSRCIATKDTRLLLAYSFPREFVHYLSVNVKFFNFTLLAFRRHVTLYKDMNDERIRILLITDGMLYASICTCILLLILWWF